MSWEERNLIGSRAGAVHFVEELLRVTDLAAAR